MSRLSILVVSLVMTFFAIDAKVLKGYQTVVAPGSPNDISLTIDSIDFRGDLTRVYGHIDSRPNTSACINSFVLNADKTPFRATDIDGFDFERRFQWEETGVLPVEIDFPVIKGVRTNAKLNIVAETNRGPYSWNITRRVKK